MRSVTRSLKTELQSSPYNGKYTEYVFVKASIAGRLSQAPGKEETDLLLVKATIMTPVSAAGVRSAPYCRKTSYGSGSSIRELNG